MVWNGFPSVDSFYIMSGLLVGYFTFKELDRTNGKINIFMFYVHRYIRCLQPKGCKLTQLVYELIMPLICFRLTGIYALVILFHVSIYQFIPWGHSNFQFVQENACKEHWWKNLAYINNFFLDGGFSVSR